MPDQIMFQIGGMYTDALDCTGEGDCISKVCMILKASCLLGCSIGHILVLHAMISFCIVIPERMKPWLLFFNTLRIQHLYLYSKNLHIFVKYCGA